MRNAAPSLAGEAEQVITALEDSGQDMLSLLEKQRKGGGGGGGVKLLLHMSCDTSLLHLKNDSPGGCLDGFSRTWCSMPLPTANWGLVHSLKTPPPPPPPPPPHNMAH